MPIHHFKVKIHDAREVALTVDKGFDDEHQDFTSGVGQRAPKRTADGEEKPPADAPFHRHRAYLARSGGSSKGDQSYRPKDIHRVSSKRWLDAVDEQIRQLSHHPGLSVLCPDWEHPDWADTNWRNWFYCAVAMDLGPDGVCATNAAEYKWHLNLDRLGDIAHGCNCDHPLVLKKMKQYNFWLCMAISWNLVFGPDKNHERKHQLGGALRALYKKSTAETTPLFMARASGIIECLKRNGHAFNSDTAEHAQAWAILSKRPFAVAEGERCTFSRFCASISACEKRTPWWEVEAFERLYLALETGVLKGGAVQKLAVFPGGAEAGSEAGHSTSSAAINLEDRTSMRCCANAVAHSAVMLEQPQNQRVNQILARNGGVIKRFYATASKQSRSAAGNEEFATNMASIGVQAHPREFMDLYPALESCGFLLTEHEIASATDFDTLEEDEFAHMYGMLQLHSVAFRSKRLLWMSSWPYRLHRINCSEEMADKTMSEFKADHLMWQEFFAFVAAPAGCPAACSALAKRSSFNRTSVKQVVAGSKEYSWTPGADLKDKMKRRSRLLSQSVLVEESIGDMKNRGIPRQTHMFRRPETCYHLSLDDGALSARSSWETPPMDAPLESKGSRLGHEAFEFDVKRRSFLSDQSLEPTRRWIGILQARQDSLYEMRTIVS
jgi:hypothetical protein